MEGSVSHSDSKFFEGEYTSMEAEFLAIVEALRVASVNFSTETSVTLYSDAKPLVRKMRGNEKCSDDWREYRESYEWLSSKFDDTEIRYCQRSDNEDAHQLARRGLETGRKG
jgi:ribonuclease HI